jgi:hypothetical protein
MMLYMVALSTGPSSFPIVAWARGESAHGAANPDKVVSHTTSTRLPYAKPDHQVGDLFIHWIYILKVSPKLLGASP